MHRQKTFFSADDYPAQNWAWVLQVRYVNLEYDGVKIDPNEFSEWKTYPHQPGEVSHFRNELRAHAALAERIKLHERKIHLRLLELRVEPKYIGYVPENEAWIE